MMLAPSVEILGLGKFSFRINNYYSGPRGALRYTHDLSRPENKGLQFAMDQIEELKYDGNHITVLLSYADLIQLGGYAAVEYTGGPAMTFRMGRKDAEESDVTPAERLPDANEPKTSIFTKM
jgi:catalase (peroxidase I)